MKPKLVTFDAGNTLLYAHPSLGEIYAQVTRELGTEIEPGRFAEALGPAYREEAAAHRPDGDDKKMWERITRRLHSGIAGLGGIPFEAWFEGLYERFGRTEVWKTFDDVSETLSALGGRGVTLGLISNWDTRLRGIVDGLGLLESLTIVKISSEAGARKPHPLMFEQAAQEARVDPADALHVGDLFAEDVLGARAAGWNAVLIDRSGLAPAAGGVRVIRRLTEIVQLLQES